MEINKLKYGGEKDNKTLMKGAGEKMTIEEGQR